MTLTIHDKANPNSKLNTKHENQGQEYEICNISSNKILFCKHENNKRLLWCKIIPKLLFNRHER